MKPYLVLLIGVLASPAALAQNTLTDQINAVDAAQARQQAAIRAQQEAQRAAELAYQRQQQEQQRAAVAAQRRREEAAAAQQKQREEAAAAEKYRQGQEAAADKKRDQDYQDQLRNIEIEQKKISLEEEKAKQARINEYIDQDLKEKSANTDVIQSNADANRNISSGEKTFLEKKGEAEIKSQSGIFK